MDLALKESAAKWKVVGRHQTIKSAGRHGSTAELTTPPDPSGNYLYIELNVLIYANNSIAFLRANLS
jgi:tartrate-resistant acid phosphatase type 5